MENMSSKYCLELCFKPLHTPNTYCPVVKIHLTVHLGETRKVKVAELAEELHKGKKFLHGWQKSVSDNL